MVAVTPNTVRRQVFTQIKGKEEEAWAELEMWAHFPSCYLHFVFSLTNFINSLVVGCTLWSTNVLSLYLFDGSTGISSHLRMSSSCWTLSSCPLPSSQLSSQACLYPESNQLYPVLTRNSTSHSIHKLIPCGCLLIISFLVPFIPGWSFGHLLLGCCSSRSRYPTGPFILVFIGLCKSDDLGFLFQSSAPCCACPTQSLLLLLLLSG